jgi:hypothetical protein
MDRADAALRNGRRRGRAWTQAEQQAGLDGKRRLTQDDPGPQTIYRVTGATGQPFFAQVELGYSARRSHP